MKKAISLIDGRNEAEVRELQAYFTEEALNFYRLRVELEWLRFMSQSSDFPLREFSAVENQIIDDLINNFNDADAERIKEIEQITNHDVKAVEMFLREKLVKTSLQDTVEWLHFACTSEDINNISWALILQEASVRVMLPVLEKLSSDFKELAQKYKNTPMLCRTHGQPATPSSVGKELLIFALRLDRQSKQLRQQEFLAKFAGATGNFAAHKIAFPKADWLSISQKFVENFGLTWNPVVAQIEPHDFIAEISHTFFRINTILIDFSRDVWMMISFNMFKQRTIAGEVGSSTMPHKVNPIDFENAEGNFGVAKALFAHFADKLPISRLQRDLSDSTVLRSIGSAFAHTLLALKKIQKGMGKLELNEAVLQKDLANNPEVLAEAVQTVMRKYAISNPYEQLKKLTRGKKMSLKSFQEFVDTLEIDETDKAILKQLTPETYIGLSEEMVKKFA